MSNQTLTAIQERVTAVYDGSDGALTKALYADLLKFGPAGIIAVDLFRAQKSSDRAKVYRGGVRGVGSCREMAYDRKQWALDNLCEALTQHAGALRICWGWKPDASVSFGDSASSVLYVYIPQIGQISFHSPAKGKGPNYQGNWDGKIGSA